jgi:hypothetical protein
VAAQLALLDALRQRALQQAGVVRVESSLVSSSGSSSSGGAARKPMRQLGARILEKPPT